MSVLIVEPSLPLRRVIRSFIKGFDADIYECGDAAAALRLCPPAPPEWVLFNLEIRDVEGVNAIVKLTGKWRDAKVVALSSYDETELREATQAAGAWAYVLKDDLSALQALFVAPGVIAAEEK